jgi:hydroxyethylthiazole kinase-like sugar kinase family protein
MPARREVADRLRAVLVAAGGDDAIELGHQLVIDGDGHALHGTAADPCGSAAVLVRYRALANAPVAAAGAMAERVAAVAAGGMHAPAAPTGEMYPSSPPAESQTSPPG